MSRIEYWVDDGYKQQETLQWMWARHQPNIKTCESSLGWWPLYGRFTYSGGHFPGHAQQLLHLQRQSSEDVCQAWMVWQLQHVAVNRQVQGKNVSQASGGGQRNDQNSECIHTDSSRKMPRCRGDRGGTPHCQPFQPDIFREGCHHQFCLSPSCLTYPCILDNFLLSLQPVLITIGQYLL